MIIYDIALTLIPEIGSIRARRLIETFGNAQEAFKADTEEFSKITGLTVSTLRKKLSDTLFPEAENELKFAQQNGIEVLSITSERYPALLRECVDAPTVLYVKGDIDFNSKKWLSIVGTRRITQYGRSMCDSIVGELAAMQPETVIVSGLAIGIDGAAHEAALRNNLKTVAVMGSSLNHIYPERHTDLAQKIIDAGGALVSEFHSRHELLPPNFLRRNRIIAGMTEGTIVVESAAKGGSLSTAHCALGYDREVMAIPGRVGNPTAEGTNELIKRDKAALVTCATDIMERLNWDIKNRNRQLSLDLENEKLPLNSLNEEERQIIKTLADGEPHSIDEIAYKTGFPSFVVSSMLFTLELKNIVKMRPGNMAVLVY